ncbi:MAG: YmdB family metallophosphoesterase [Nitrospira sp.]|nr:YmdB family metallophosphoesterase [Nitrospira sp.]
MSRVIRVLALGDLVGRPGRRVIREGLGEARTETRADFVIVNVENAANGAGVREKDAVELLGYGVDCLTSGDHIYDYPAVFPYLEVEPRLLRPCNYDLPGRGAAVYQTPGGVPIGVANVSGTVFMNEKPGAGEPFAAIDEAVERLHEETPIVLVDVHCEATSEKIAMGWHLDGRASAVFGSHTHVQTADIQILPGGSGYITDLGMTGPHLGVIGRDKDAVLRRFRDGERAHMAVAKEWLRMTGAVFTIDIETGRCLDAELFSRDLPSDD